MEKYKYFFKDNKDNKDNKIQNYKKFYIITLILLLINYVFWFWQFNFCTINTHIISSLILVIPIILIILIYIISKKEKIKSKVGVGISIALIILFLFLNTFTFIFVIVKEGTSYEDNPLKYNHIRSIAGYKNVTYQFPDKIPQELLQKNKVEFYYTPQFLQGGFNFELLLEMENNEIDDYIGKYETYVKKIIEVNTENIDKLYSEYGIYKPELIDYEDKEEFFTDSKIYLLESKSYKPNNWNHGYVAYMAKNENMKKLLLVTEVW
jgi:hypothetical protein